MQSKSAWYAVEHWSRAALRRLDAGAATAAWSVGVEIAAGDIIEGRVVDASGKPVTEAQVSSFWNWTGGQPAAMRGLALDESGRFEVDTGPHGRSAPVLIAYADCGNLAGVVTVVGSTEDELVITLRPSVQVRGRFVCSDLGGDPGSITAYWQY